MLVEGPTLEGREAELLEALAPHVEPRPVGWTVVVALVAAGLSLCLGTAWAVARMPAHAVALFEPPVQPEQLQQALDAYQRGEWDASEKYFREILSKYPGHARSQDYVERIELTRRDAERLARAEEALVAGQPQRARDLASSVAPNSGLFAQAESVARNAREQLEKTAGNRVEQPAGPTEPAALGLDVTVALGEALALYEAGNFVEAASRAQTLALQAQGAVQADLVQWAQDVKKFAQRYGGLPRDPANLVNHTDEATEAIALDERLSDGHYGRGLRERMADALCDLSVVLLDSGDVVGGCARLREAETFAERERRVDLLSRRCEGEAFRRIVQARGLETQRPQQALKLYRQALVIAVRGSSSYRAAQRSIDELEWSEKR